jgi:hypothetical protein
MSDPDKPMLLIEGKRPVPWDQFCDAARGEKEFTIIEQRRFEECSVVPSPENDVIVGSALVVWSPSCISVLKSHGKEDYPIAVAGGALEHVFRNVPTQSHILLMPETLEVLEALKTTNDMTSDNMCLLSSPQMGFFITSSCGTPCRQIGMVKRIAAPHNGNGSLRRLRPAGIAFRYASLLKREIMNGSR